MLLSSHPGLPLTLPALPVTLGHVLKWQHPCGSSLVLCWDKAPLVLMGHPRWGHLSLQRRSRTAPGVSSGLQCNVRSSRHSWSSSRAQNSPKPPQTPITGVGLASNWPQANPGRFIKIINSRCLKQQNTGQQDQIKGELCPGSR